ncbi:hypothetical protein BJ878DRAFT_540008 [Calycina marina]|uniref:Arrestin C-terminal-like domain-containing protein n=1 Tax=Calycina marina TaxID=1763456 RepID=A0A9P8CGY7_9HELO|nr:hypothetical protein BJ878DRAFT_540008 [Calycina marina]
MPATTVNYFGYRGLITYTPPEITSTGQWHFTEPPCRPRGRRPYSIHIFRSPSGFVPHELRPSPPPKPPRKPSRLCIEFTKLASRVNAKVVLNSIFSSPNPSAITAASASSSSAGSRSTSPIVLQDPPSGAGALADTTMQHRLFTPGAAGNVEADMSRMPLDNRGVLASELTSNSRNRAVSAASSGSITEQEKPVASGGGISCYITLAEPTVYLTGLDHDGTTRDSRHHAQAMLRGRLQLRVSKSVKIKAVTLTFMGTARTEWPEGIPPAKAETYEKESLKNETIPFFNAQFAGSENGYGDLCTYALRPGSENSSAVNLNSILPTNLGDKGPAAHSSFSIPILGGSKISKTNNGLTSKEAKRLSLQVNHNQARSFTKADSAFGPTPAQKGFKTFHPGVYEYPFELCIDNNSPETTSLPNATVKWMLNCEVVRSGTFKSNLQGEKEVLVVRSPSEDSLELVEPISISRKWEDQLHYDIMISGKSFPLGSKMPIAFKLTPLAKVQVHKLKVYVSENIEYFTNDHKVARRDANGNGRKILLLEKTAGKPLAKEYSHSEVRVLAGGELDAESRAKARAQAERYRSQDERNNGPLPEPTDNLLGDIDLGLDHFNAATEIEMQVQLPTCEQMEKDPTKRMAHDCTWKNVKVHHWIKIVMRISRKDGEGPNAKRRHFEISIDSPFTLLNCRATRDNLALPEYSGPSSTSLGRQYICGCPNAAVANATPPSSSESVPTLLSMTDASEHAETFHQPNLALPQQAHVHSGNDENGVRRQAPQRPLAAQRPIHLMRPPSYAPPGINEDELPPPLTTPPPLYDHVIGTPSHNGLADYFARYDETYDDSEDECRASNRGRVNVVNPRTPGGRIARSMEIDRTFMFNDGIFNRSNREDGNVAQAHG